MIMLVVKQEEDKRLLQVTKTVEWLIKNTNVSAFNPVTFEGYQRQIDETHCNKIVKYLNDGFYMPSAIICAIDQEFTDDSPLRVVDGQHRICALRMIKDKDKIRYDDIKQFQLPVIVIQKPELEDEINTFITINKTSKKVDTSLALVLKNKLTSSENGQTSSVAKRQYIAVEVALRLNSSDSIWTNNILYEGDVKHSQKMISLNSFVKATTTLLSTLDSSSILKIQWDTAEEVEKIISKCQELVGFIWELLSIKWSNLFTGEKQNSAIIQGAIGYTSITKFVTLVLKSNPESFNFEQAKNCIESSIKKINISEKNWLPGEIYSKYSSGSGYKLIANELYKSITP